MANSLDKHPFTKGISRKTVELSNGVLTYWKTKQSRSKPSALFIHDLGGRAAEFIPRLFQQEHFNCLAPYLPFHGGSKTEIHDGSSYDYALALAEFITQENLKIDLVVSHGNSFSIAFELLKNQFIDAEEWILMSPSALLPTEPLMQDMVQKASKFNKWSSENLDQLLQKFRIGMKHKPKEMNALVQFLQLEAISNNPAFFDDFLKSITKSCLSVQLDQLDKLPCRKRIVYGDKDPFLPLEISMMNLEQWEQFIATEMPSAKAKKIENCGHYPHLEQPEYVLELMEKF